jgi:hypothetical protein
MEYQKIGLKGLAAADRGAYRDAANLCLKAVKKAPIKIAKMRYYYFYMYTMILRELHFDATESELKFLQTKFLDSPLEPPHFRVSASLCLGVVRSSQGDRELAADAYREGILIGKHATPTEKAAMVYSDDGEFPASYFMESTCGTIANNLSILTGRGRVPGYTACAEVRNDGTPMPIVGAFEKVCLSQDNVGELMENKVLERVQKVGGEKCDCCGKSRQALGLAHLEVCSRCRFMFYCGKDCQKASWRAGHKKACRKPDQIEVGDYMKLAGLGSRRELNGEIVKVVESAGMTSTGGDKEPLRYKVELLSTRNTVSTSNENLKHIRPAK